MKMASATPEVQHVDTAEIREWFGRFHQVVALADTLDAARAMVKSWYDCAEARRVRAEAAEAEVVRLRVLLDAAQRHIDAHEYGNGSLDRLIEDLERERDEWRARSEDAEAALADDDAGVPA